LQPADIIKHNGRLISHAVKKLVEDYESNKNSVIFQILAMLFEVILALGIVFLPAAFTKERAILCSCMLQT